MTEIISREDARAKGVPRFFTGQACKHGHLAERRTTDGRCVQCSSLANKPGSKRAYWKNPKDKKLKASKWFCKKRYGITYEEVQQMLQDQEGLCNICNEPMQPHCIDHCHETGIVRGLLCHHCNKGLGFFKDDPERLLRAVDYLKPAA